MSTEISVLSDTKNSLQLSNLLSRDNLLTPLFIDKLEYLPLDYVLSFGCGNCPWRNLRVKCPCTSDIGFTVHSKGICGKRLFWLLSLLPAYSSVPTLDRLNRDYSLAMGRIKMEKYQEMEDKFHSMMLGLGDFHNMSESNKEYYLLYNKFMDVNHKRWLQLWRDFSHISDAQLGRETTKKVEVHKEQGVRMREISSILKGRNIKEVE